jgi:hypothetical protein
MYEDYVKTVIEPYNNNPENEHKIENPTRTLKLDRYISNNCIIKIKRNPEIQCKKSFSVMNSNSLEECISILEDFIVKYGLSKTIKQLNNFKRLISFTTKKKTLNEFYNYYIIININKELKNMVIKLPYKIMRKIYHTIWIIKYKINEIISNPEDVFMEKIIRKLSIIEFKRKHPIKTKHIIGIHGYCTDDWGSGCDHSDTDSPYSSDESSPDFD